MRSFQNGFKGFTVRLLCMSFSLGMLGCTSFLGATLPPGASGGVFSKNPSGLPVMSRVMHGHQKDLAQATNQKLQMQYRVLRHLNATSKDFRKQLTRRSAKWINDFEAQGTINRQELNLVLEGAHWVVELDTLLFSLWKEYRFYLPYASEPDIYAPSRGANLLDKTTRMKGGLLILAAEMMRMDNASVVIQAAEGLPLLTFLMNRGDDKIGVPGESFDRMTGQFYEPDRRWLLRKFLFDVEYSQHELNSLAAHDTDVAFALAVIQQSEQAAILKKEGAVARQRNYSWAVAERTWMSFLTPFYLWQLDQGINEKSKGKTKKLNTLAETDKATEGFFDHLEPMDVILIDEQKRDVGGKKDRFDHAVIYLGSYHSIKGHDLDSHPAIDMYGNSMRRGYTFLELASGGIKLWSLDEILQVNEVVIIRYAKGSDSNNLSQINSNADDYDALEEHPEDIEVKTNAGWERASGDVIQDKNIGNMSGALQQSGQWSAFSQKDMQRRALLQRTLGLMLKPDFINPPVLSDPERSSLLMSAVFGTDELGVTLRAGQNMPTLTQMLTAAVVVNGIAEIPFVVLNGHVHSGGQAKLNLIQDFSNRE